MKGIFTIIATAENTFLAISEQLRNMELSEFEDFIFYPLIDRKMVLLHGNCHMSIVKEYLESCEYFNKEYYIYYNPLICNNTEHKIRKEVLKNCDVWIHEDIQENNAYGIYLSDKYHDTDSSKASRMILDKCNITYRQMLFRDELK